MKKLLATKATMKGILKDQRGEFSIKGIAITVAVIVLIGFTITIVQGNLGGWITQVWNMFIDQIKGLM